MLGDSTAAGQGCGGPGRPRGAARLGARGGGRAAGGSAERGAAGARSDDLERQVSLLLADPARTPDVCVIMIGANDVTHRMPATQSVRCLTTAVRRLRTAGRRWSWDLPGPGHDRTGLPAAAVAGPAGEQAAGGGADDRLGGAGRAHGVAGRPAGPGVRGEPARAVRSRQLPPLRRGVRHGGDGGAAHPVRGAGPVAGVGPAGQLAPRGHPPGGQGGFPGGPRSRYGGHGGPRPVGPPQAPQAAAPARLHRGGTGGAASPPGHGARAHIGLRGPGGPGRPGAEQALRKESRITRPAG
ncbi:hypothetical protein HFP43_22010 [Streptomyces sp. SJ1-7]|nr:hypothetical protein [Streptomyces sp. SJ1-7]